MRIRATCHLCGQHGSTLPGAEIDVPDEVAVVWIRDGAAVPVGVAVIETATAIPVAENPERKTRRSK